MADVATRKTEWIDALLVWLIDAWEELPQVAQEINTWDWVEQVDYIEEWTPKMQLLAQLRNYARTGQLTAKQQSHYAHLEDLVRQYESQLETLRRS